MNKKKYKLLLVNPVNSLAKGFVGHPSSSHMPLALGVIAALTPEHWEIEFVDESFEELTFRPADLLGLTSFTANAVRAYEIAAMYREKGIHTVMGGIHASMMTEEVMQHVDTVVSGEAEIVWPLFLKDFESGKPAPLYKGGIVPVELIPKARRDIFHYPYVYDLIQTSRGCPMGCDFCSVTQMCGKKYRERPIEDVLDEMEEMQRPYCFIVDDHLVNNNKHSRQRAISLFKGMVERGIKKLWLGQASINFADDDNVLRWAAKSGCTLILLGIEAETEQALSDVKKRLNLKRGVDSYKIGIRKIHKHGIAILGAMIFGMESDGKDELFARRDFVRRSGIDAMQLSIMTPLPGTGLYFRMRDENKIVLNNFPNDWQHYHFVHATMGTSKLSREELEKIMQNIYWSMYNKDNFRKMMFKTLWRTRSLKAAYWAYGTNHNYGRMVLENKINDKPDGLNNNLEWNSGKRSLYLKLTDYVLMLFYAISWNKLQKQLIGQYINIKKKG